MRTDAPRSLRAAAALVLALGPACSAVLPLSMFGDPDDEAAAGEPYSYQPFVTGDGAGFAEYELTVAPAEMAVNGVGRVSWIPTLDDLGEHDVRLVVRTQTESIAQVWSVRVHQGVELGTTFSPRGHTSSQTDSDVVAHLQQHGPWGRVIAFHSAWRDSVEGAGEIPEVALAAGLASESYPFALSVGFGWTDGEGQADLTSESNPDLNSWSNFETRVEFRSMVTEYAERFEPPYLFLGNETNLWSGAGSEAEWLNWVTQLEECVAAIGEASPDTVVFTSFQLERLHGLGDGLNGWGDAPQWDLVDDVAGVPGLDALGFTSYPYFEYAAPADVPADLYGAIRDHWSGPVCFTEIGWLAAPSPPYPGGEQAQADFVARFFELTGSLDLAYAAWLFLHDLDGHAAQPAFQFVGLRNNAGNEIRLADQAWRAEVASREE